jgi:hypothetical protein
MLFRRSSPAARTLMIPAALFAGMALSDAINASSLSAFPALVTQVRTAGPAATPAKRRASKPAAKPSHRLQTTTLRYTDLSSLPRVARRDFHGASSPTAENQDDAEVLCARAKSGSSGIPPCLGLSRIDEVRAPITFSFDLALKSLAAPKDVFIGQCPPGSNNGACNSALADARAEQERLANTVNQRRSPVGTFGIAVDF